eukprot:m.78088 g.78088  ORF g.78088 m.78088 type:complete len:181 (+) comp8561_c0_seq7:4224-4766(+)
MEEVCSLLNFRYFLSPHHRFSPSLLISFFFHINHHCFTYLCCGGGIKDKCLRIYFDNGRGLRWKVMETVVQKLQKLRKDANKWDGFRFFSISLLIVYEAHNENHIEDNTVDVRLIDFARTHTPLDIEEDNADPKGSDYGFLHGLDSLIAMLKHILAMRDPLKRKKKKKQKQKQSVELEFK